MKPITIHRYHKHEAEQAIKDLQDRGFILSYPLTEIKRTGTEKGTYCYRKEKYTSRHATTSSTWMAKLIKKLD